MNTQNFGGDWTQDKLNCLRKYLEAYMHIFKSNRRARYYKTIYVDAFAGTGYYSAKSKLDHDTNNYLKGSARIALELDQPFDSYLFIEKDKNNVDELKDTISRFPNLHTQILQGDTNIVLCKWLKSINWNYNRAVVFLDPFSMEVNWDTITAISSTQAIDLWYLVPMSISTLRLLPKNKLPDSGNENTLTKLFGSDSWKKALYPPSSQLSLFGEKSYQRVNWIKVGEYVIQRLQSCFIGVHTKPLVLRNHKNSPLFLFTFSVSNTKARFAIEIADSIIKRVN